MELRRGVIVYWGCGAAKGRMDSTSSALAVRVEIKNHLSISNKVLRTTVATRW